MQAPPSSLRADAERYAGSVSFMCGCSKSMTLHADDPEQWHHDEGLEDVFGATVLKCGQHLLVAILCPSLLRSQGQ